MSGLNSFIDIPRDWRVLLSRIQQVCPSAVIAGGALRDRDNGREVNDLDLFVNASGDRYATSAIEALREAGFTVEGELSDITMYPEDQNLEVVRVVDLTGHGLRCPHVQVVFTNWDTAKIVERFDYGICRLSYDGEKIVRPPEYDEDREAKVFRLRRDRPTPVSMRGSIHRYARLVRKYEGWTWWPYESGDSLV